MKYMGSKSRIAKYIVPIIQKYIDDTGCKYYLEPFVGGANVIDKIKCSTKIGSDKNKYLIALLQRAQANEPLYTSVSKELYDAARTAFNNGDDTRFFDWEMGNIGFLASYNGRWFDGGYAKSGYEKTKNGERYRDYYREAKDNLLEQAPNLKGIKFSCKDYRYYNGVNLKGFVIYVDPPYQNTKQYANATSFNYEEFWQTMRDWSKNNIVLISEQNAPDDFECIWEQEVSRSIKANDKSKSTEKLFVYNK
jgi:DNA adenine methylase